MRNRMFTRALTGRTHPRYGCGMRVNSEHVYRDAVTAHRLPQGISVVPLPQLALAFSQMAKDLRSQNAPAEQQDAFQAAIAQAAESAQHLTAGERIAVQHTLFTAFDGLPRRHSAMPVRADFLRQVRFPVATGSFASEYASAAR
jgi:hypothetical protein